jgi:hypothetical protein
MKNLFLLSIALIFIVSCNNSNEKDAAADMENYERQSKSSGIKKKNILKIF